MKIKALLLSYALQPGCTNLDSSAVNMSSIFLIYFIPHLMCSSPFCHFCPLNLLLISSLKCLLGCVYLLIFSFSFFISLLSSKLYNFHNAFTSIISFYPHNSSIKQAEHQFLLMKVERKDFNINVQL